MVFFSKKGAQSKGNEGETLALRHFQKNGYQIREQNWKTRRGEVDLIVERRNALYFVEVKYRKSFNFGRGEESIHPAKQKKILMAALGYLQHRGIRDKEIHFGGLIIDGSVTPPKIDWIEFPLDLPPQCY